MSSTKVDKIAKKMAHFSPTKNEVGMLITQQKYCDAVGVGRDTTVRRLSGVPSSTGPFGRHLYNVLDALPTVRRSEVAAGLHVALLDTAEGDIHPTFVGDTADRQAAELELWMDTTGQNEPRWRLDALRTAFCNALALSQQSAVLWPYAEALRRRLACVPGVLRAALTNDMTTLPRWPEYAPAFAIANASPVQEMEFV